MVRIWIKMTICRLNEKIRPNDIKREEEQRWKMLSTKYQHYSSYVLFEEKASMLRSVAKGITS